MGTFLECMKVEAENVPQEMKDKLIITINMYVTALQNTSTIRPTSTPKTALLLRMFVPLTEI